MSLNAKYYLYGLILLALIILISSFIIRDKYNAGYPIGDESYNTLRYGRYIAENNVLPQEDPYSYGSRPFINEFGYPLILSFMPDNWQYILPLIFGLLSLFFYYKIVEKTNPEVKVLASLLLIISPIYIYLFSTTTKHSIGLFLLFLGFYSYIKDNKKLSILIFSLLAFFNYLLSLTSVLLFLAYSIKNKKWNDFVIMLILNITIFLVQFKTIFSLGFPETIFGAIHFSMVNFFSVILSDFGSKLGISIFVLVLGFIGIYYHWKDNFRYIFIYLAVLISLLISVYIIQSFVLVFPFLTFTAAYGIVALIKHEWKSNILKQITILIIICGLLFSGLSYINRISTFTPTAGFGEGLSYIKELNSTGIIFSDYIRGVYISYAKKSNFMDAKFLYAPNFKQRYADSGRILHGKNIKETVALINRYNIDYIWIDKELKESLWGKTDIELLFFLKYSPENFEKVFDNGDVEIYKYVGIEKGTKAGIQ